MELGMIGGDKAAFQRAEVLFQALAPGSDGISKTPGRTDSSTAEQGYLYCGPQEHTFGKKVLSAMRRQFGGHVEPPSGG